MGDVRRMEYSIDNTDNIYHQNFFPNKFSLFYLISTLYSNLLSYASQASSDRERLLSRS